MTAAIFGLMPVAMLESIILRSGVAAVIAAAEPPLGSTARIVLILIGGGFVGMLAWLGLFLLIGPRMITLKAGKPLADKAPAVPVLRRADAHPDAPARAPLLAARDLGTPFLDVRARELATDEAPEPAIAAMPLPAAPAPAPIIHQHPPVRDPLPLKRAPMDVPRDLDQPLAAFDPEAILDQPLPPPEPPLPALATSPRPQLIDPGERFETFELTPLVRSDPAMPVPAPAPRAPIDTKATLAALLERLERGVSHRADPPAPEGEGLAHTLGALRQMAIRS